MKNDIWKDFMLIHLRAAEFVKRHNIPFNEEYQYPSDAIEDHIISLKIKNDVNWKRLDRLWKRVQKRAHKGNYAEQEVTDWLVDNFYGG